MYLNLDGEKVLEMSYDKVEGWYYTDVVPSPPPLNDGDRAYVRYNKNIEKYYFENEKGEVI